MVIRSLSLRFVAFCVLGRTRVSNRRSYPTPMVGMEATRATRAACVVGCQRFAQQGCSTIADLMSSEVAGLVCVDFHPRHCSVKNWLLSWLGQFTRTRVFGGASSACLDSSMKPGTVGACYHVPDRIFPNSVGKETLRGREFSNKT